MARAGGGGGGAEPRRRRERSRSREESKAGESMSSSTGMANQHPVFLSWRSLEGSRHIRKKGRGQHGREWESASVRPDALRSALSLKKHTSTKIIKHYDDFYTL